MHADDTASATRLRVFAETVDHRRLCSREVLGALRSRGLQLVVSATPSEPDPRAVILAARSAGVSVALWPMLADRAGRWASSANAAAFVEAARRQLDVLEATSALPDELCVDLEPPLSQLRRAIDRGRLSVPGSRSGAVAQLTALIDDAAALGIAGWAAVAPVVLADTPSSPSWQDLLGTPVDALPLRRVCVMLYTSIAVGYGRGVLRRSDAEGLLAAAAAHARARFGARTSVAIGAVGRGALGDEATFRDIDELRTDVALVRTAGVDDLALFDLGGVLARDDWEAWLDAFTDPSPPRYPPPPSRRARMLWWTAGAVARVRGLRRK